MNKPITLEEELRRRDKVIQVLMDRLERGDQLGNTHFSLFQSAIALQQEVESKTEDLNQALEALGATSYRLKDAYLDQKRAHQNLSSALEALDEGFALFKDGELVVCNEHFRGLLPDISPAIEAGLSFEDYVQLVSQSEFMSIGDERDKAQWRKRRSEHHRQHLSTFVIELSGDRWYQISDRQTSFGSVAILQTDITDIVRENRLKRKLLIDEHQSYVQNAFDHLPIGIASLSPDFRVQVFNARFAELFQLPLTLIKKGASFERLVQEIDQKNLFSLREPYSGLMDWFRAHSVENNNVILDRKDGVILAFQIHALPSGEYIANAIDVTSQMSLADALAALNSELEARVETRTRDIERVNHKLRQQNTSLEAIQQELQAAKESAEQANYSKSRFLAAASHDLMQPISAAKLCLALLKNPDNPKRADYLHRLGQNIESVEHLITDLLDMSRLESQQPKFSITAFPAMSLFKKLRENLEPLTDEKGLDLRFVESSDWLFTDKHYAYRILQNLVVNAIQNSESGKILVGARHREGRVWLQVWDQGRGILERDLKRIFEEFTQLEDSKSPTGVGLGLSIVERACRHLDLPIKIHSEWRRGSVFEIGFQSAPRQFAEDERDAVVDLRSVETLDRLIFLIENDEQTLKTTSELLEYWGARVIAVRGISEAIAQLGELDEEPDLIIADYQLDQGDLGTQVIRAIRARCHSRIPAILVTANAEDRLYDQQKPQSFVLLSKPLNADILRKTIDRSLLQSNDSSGPNKVKMEIHK